MNFFSFLLCIAALLSAFSSFGEVCAHTYLSSVTIDGQKQAACIRPLESNSPVMPLTTNPAMVCGLGPKATQPAPQKCAVAAGSKLGLQWNHNSATPDDDIIDGSHMGPCLVYLSRDQGATWFKVFERGYNTTISKFCVTTLIEQKGYLEFQLPTDIAKGDYLMRTEIIALHEAFPGGNGAQPYISCAELVISGGGNAKPSGVVFPGAYKTTDPGIAFNLYVPFTEYIIPGPPLHVSGSNDGGNNGGDTSDSDDGKNGGGMSPGGAAALSLFIIALVVALAVGAFFYKKNGHIFGYTLKGKKKNEYTGVPQQGTPYTAYTEQGKA